MFALFPMLIFLTSLVGFLPGVREAIFKALARVVPGEAMGLVSQTIFDVTRNRSGGLVSFGVLGALWAASGGVNAVMDTLNVAYDIEEERSFWKVRLMAIGLTILLSIMIVGGTTLIMFGDRFSAWLAARFVLMLWLYVAGAVVLIGGELNSVIAHAAGKPIIQKELPDLDAADPGEFRRKEGCELRC